MSWWAVALLVFICVLLGGALMLTLVVLFTLSKKP